MRDYPLARRGVLMTGLISGFTLATQRVEAQAIHTDATGLDAGEIQIPTTDGKLPAYYAKPARKGPFPVILVNEEIFGVHEYIKDVCRRWAKLGYLAVATEYYARIGDLSKMTDVKQIMTDVILKAPDDQYMSDLDSTAAWALQNGGSSTRVGVMGFCRGGRQTWLYAAHSPHLKAAVAFYGPLLGTPSPIQPHTALDLAAEIKCPLLGLYGGQDTEHPGRFGAARRRPRRRPRTRSWRSSSIPTRRMASTPTTGRATGRRMPRMRGSARLAWFHRFGVRPGRLIFCFGA